MPDEGRKDFTTLWELERAQGRQADAEARQADAMADAATADALRSRSKMEKDQIEMNHVALLSKGQEYANVLSDLTIEKAREQRDEELAANKYWHIYNFNGEVSSNSVDKAIHQLTSWHRLNSGCEIEIMFNSGGGFITDGMALFDYIRYLRSTGHTITTSTIGMAASMASVLLQAGDIRIMGREAWLLIHEASFGSFGKTGEVEDTLEWIRAQQQRILAIFAERSTLNVGELKERWLRKDWWIDSDEALGLGLVDEIR